MMVFLNPGKLVITKKNESTVEELSKSLSNEYRLNHMNKQKNTRKFKDDSFGKNLKTEHSHVKK